MKTIVKIPFEKAPADPEWLIKKHAGHKLNALEMEQYRRYAFDEEHRHLLVETCPARVSSSLSSDSSKKRRHRIWAGVPPENVVRDVLFKYSGVLRNYTKCMA